MAVKEHCPRASPRKAYAFRRAMSAIGSFRANVKNLQCGEQIDPACCGVAVGWPSPGCAAAAKGDGVHVLKGHLSWVQNGAISVWSKSFSTVAFHDSSCNAHRRA